MTSAALYHLGIRLMDGALACGKPPTSWRVQTAFRDGLIIALLALIPLRRRTLSALRIGKHLIKSGDQWSLEIPAEDVKSKRPLDYPISPELSQRIDVYVNQIRSQTAGAGTHDYLWASSRGRPMRGQVIYNSVRRRTRKALGFPINLHRFRRAAATLWSVQDPANVRGVQGPTRSCIICYDGEVLRHGAVAPCGACARASHRQGGKKTSGFVGWRAPDYESGGQEFESLRARQRNALSIIKQFAQFARNLSQTLASFIAGKHWGSRRMIFSHKSTLAREAGENRWHTSLTRWSHEDGWAYTVNGAFSESFPTHAEAPEAARKRLFVWFSDNRRVEVVRFVVALFVFRIIIIVGDCR